MKLNELRKQVKEIECIFPWYAKMLTNSNNRYFSNLKDLPYINYDILEKYYYTQDLTVDDLGNLLVFKSSGTSTGVRKKIYWSVKEHEDYIIIRTNIFKKYIPTNIKSACVILGIGHAAASGKEIFDNMEIKAFNIDYKSPIGEIVKLLIKNNPEVIYTMPLIIDKIIDYVLNESISLTWRPQIIITVGDVITNSWIKKVQDFFDIDINNIFDLYGSTEVGLIAYKDNELDLYLFAEGILPEVINIDDKDILVLTSLNRVTFPAIRLVTNDIIEGFTKIKINNQSFYTFKKIMGRLGEETKHGENLCIYDICEAVNIYLKDAQFEVYKTTDNFKIKISSNELTDEISEKIIEHVEKLNPNIKEMIDNGFINPFIIEKVSRADINSRAFKRSIKKIVQVEE